MRSRTFITIGNADRHLQNRTPKAWDIEASLVRCWLDGSVRPAPSVSFGIQMLTGDNLQTDIEQADQAMYEHKALRSDGGSGLTNHRSIHGV
ncbi:GGDEF domain-containing protein [Litorivicinus sp.]|nr:GGDEF domain-containing protein [Litorivicinus sp.]